MMPHWQLETSCGGNVYASGIGRDNESGSVRCVLPGSWLGVSQHTAEDGDGMAAPTSPGGLLVMIKSHNVSVVLRTLARVTNSVSYVCKNA